MKSVVVEASTVAKAIEIAWLKAEKPEEFFIRILQEHSSGFLGFGAQKAKIVLFFKNTQKSDSLFPVVLKQKEYSSFFGNAHLKAPAQMNVVDHELNKNVSLGGGQQKKKHQNNQQNQQKPKQHNQQVDTHATANKGMQARDAVHVDKASQGQIVKQVKIQHVSQSFHLQKPLVPGTELDKPIQQSPKLQVTLQTPVVAKIAEEHKVGVHKEGVVKDITKVLKKVQTQKVVANVSRSAHSVHDKNTVKSDKVAMHDSRSKHVDSHKKTVSVEESIQSAEQGFKRLHKTAPKPAHQKYETYEDFINSTTSVSTEKESIVSQLSAAEAKIEDVQFVQKQVGATSLVQEQTVLLESAPVSLKPIAHAAQLRSPLKMKRRPLSTENSGVSGITRALVEKKIDEVVDVHADLDKKE